MVKTMLYYCNLLCYVKSSTSLLTCKAVVARASTTSPTHSSEVNTEVHRDYSSHSSESCIFISHHIGAGTDGTRVWDDC